VIKLNSKILALIIIIVLYWFFVTMPVSIRGNFLPGTSKGSGGSGGGGAF